MLGWLLLLVLIGLCFRKPIMGLFGRGNNNHREVMQQQQANYHAVQVQPIQPVYVYHQPHPSQHPYFNPEPQPIQRSHMQVNVHQPSLNDEFRAQRNEGYNNNYNASSINNRLLTPPNSDDE